MINKQPTSPSHIVYAVTKGKDKRSYWRKIGAAFAHSDGEGFNILLEYLPLNGGDIVIRKPKSEASEPATDEFDAPPTAASAA
jgi:hypothetical protein